jgi:methyl-accepting chemotaxis protein
MLLTRFRIGQRLALVFGLVITVFLVMAAVAYSSLHSLSGQMATLVGGRYENTVLANQLKAEIGDASRSMLAVLVMTDEAQTQKELAVIDGIMKNHRATLERLAALPSDETSAAQLKELTALRDKFVPAQAGFVKLVAEGNKDDALVKYMFSVRGVQSKYLATLDAFVLAQHKLMGQASEASGVQAQRMGWLIAALALGATLASVVVGVVATRSITRPLNRAVGIAQKVAAGDLSTRIEVRTHDETGQLMHALHEMNESLRGIVGNVRGGTESIAAASAQIASGNQDLSARTETQAATLEQTSSAIRALTDTVRHNAETAHQASSLAGQAQGVAAEGGAVVAQVVATMSSIDASSKKIVDIISVIDGIAFQTNILALNAAVEAARAGEQGRGFAVVAGEVRTLAQRSAAAAREIKALIGDSVQRVSQGSTLVAQAGQTMQGVVDSVSRVAGLISEIASASQAQRDGIESVNHTINQIDASTQQNAALVEQAAAAAESLKTQASALENTVSLFKLQASAA